MADKIARCPASANTTVAVRRPRVPSRPVNSGRCEHHQRAAGTFNGFTWHLSRTTAAIFTRFYSPASSSLSRTVPPPPFPSFFLPNSTFLFFYSSFDLPTSLSRFLFPRSLSLSLSIFSSPSPSHSPVSLERTARRSFVLGRKKIAARRDTQRARRLFFGTRTPEIERASDGRAGGRTVCGMKKIVREKSECSYQSAMQTRGFASVMPGERERKKGNINVGRRGCMERRLARKERDLVRL